VTGASLASSYVARNGAMGGVGVASSNYDAASTANPALLTEFRPEDDLALIIPAIGAVASDEANVLDSLDAISDSIDLLETQIDNLDPGAINTGQAIISELQKIDEVPAGAQITALISVSNPGKNLGWAIGLQTYIEGAALANYENADAALIAAAILTNDSSLLDNFQSSGIAVAGAVSELTFSLAHEFQVGGTRVSVGVTPKFQSVDTVLYEASAADFNSDDFEFDSDTYATDDSNLNLDLGASWWVTEKINFGLMLRDLISEEYATADLVGTSAVCNVDPEVTAGVAYNGKLITAALDIDLTKNASFSDIMVNGVAVSTKDTLFGKTQFVRAGVEFNAFNWAQLRAGYRTDIEGNRDDLFTLGVGLSPFDVFHIELTGAVGENDTYGGMVQLRFTF
jgi:hypothetical protein